jgi:hypothetical protein
LKRLIIILFLFSIQSYGQKNCGFIIDKERILKNEDLDYFLEKFETEKFEITNLKESIPKHINKQLKCLADGFSIANPNEEFQDSDVVDESKKLADRGLVFLAKSENTLILYYGISSGPGISSKYLFIDFDSKGIKKIWCGFGIGINRNIKTLKDIADRIKLYRNKTLGLQTGIVYF